MNKGFRPKDECAGDWDRRLSQEKPDAHIRKTHRETCHKAGCCIGPK